MCLKKKGGDHFYLVTLQISACINRTSKRCITQFVESYKRKKKQVFWSCESNFSLIKTFMPQFEIQVTLVLVSKKCTTAVKEEGCSLSFLPSPNSLCLILFIFSQHFLCIVVSVLKAACYKSSPQLKRCLYTYSVQCYPTVLLLEQKGRRPLLSARPEFSWYTLPDNPKDFQTSSPMNSY